MFLNFGQLKTTADLTNGSHFSLLLAIGEKITLSTVNNYGGLAHATGVHG